MTEQEDIPKICCNCRHFERRADGESTLGWCRDPSKTVRTLQAAGDIRSRVKEFKVYPWYTCDNWLISLSGRVWKWK